MILPFVRDLFPDLERSTAFERIRQPLAAGVGRRRVSGLTATARAIYLPLLVRAAKVPVFVVVADNRAAESLQITVQAACDLTGALDRESVIRLPAHDVLPFENLSPHPEIQEQRAVALWKITSGMARIIILPIESACYRIFSAEHYANLTCTVRRGEEVDPESLVMHLATVGYQRADMVEMRGQFALRGGILDVYPPEADQPIRIEFFGDEIESMRKFDPETQRSASPADEALLLPLTETPLTEALLARVHVRLSGQRLEGDAPAILEAITAEGAHVFPGWEFFAAAASGSQQTIFDLLPKSRVFVEEPAMVQNQLDRWWNKVEQRHERSGVDTLFTPGDLYLSPWEWQTRIATAPGLDIDQLGAVDILDIDTTSLTEASFSTRPTLRLHGSIPALVEQLHALAEQEMRVLLAVPNQGEVERLAGILREYGISYRIGSRNPHLGSETQYDESSYMGRERRPPVIVRVAIANGVVLPDAQLVIYGANDLTDEAEVVAARPRQTQRKSKTSAFISDFRDLTVGDYVVHVEHGIARYLGLKEIAQDGLNVEFMILEFAEQARLYVPLTRLDLIQKYRSTESGPAAVLNRLGSQQWARTKARVKKAMEDMADELLKLYAARKAAQGHAFTSDNEFQREFEDAFDFNETEDQISAIADIKRDMESTMPMDRLLCGDVGYGKTEVAMRAAFKAVQDGKQVAVLTPTTVLCFQHFETFKRRFSAFPVKVEMISRFRTPKEQKQVLEQVEQGKVDILIGTHRLLSKDLSFQDLGLLVIDEEQRFGVRHKERLKQLRREIDVLAMSATPIPRTLHMSLVGLRDMSVIETPPKDRMAIQTVVAKFDEKVIRSAIEVELERGGQTYVVHNRVESIYDMATRIQELVPQARIIVGHGQMGESELERVMLAFMHHEYDVLVATTIIENGLDIPLANTIVINRADRHGLSELYQLRGRVGRSNRRAYSYLLIPPDQELTEIARRRLAALKEFSDLGAGFKIAALDLELRGAGNMLGGEQSGHIEAVGFELYTTMLEEAVRSLKGEDQVGRPSVQLNLGISLRIDNSYIAEENQRLRMYKRIAGAENETVLDDIRTELEDRYGPIPEPVEHLLAAGRIRTLCEQTGIAQIDRKRDFVSLRFTENAGIDLEKLMQLVAKNSKRGAQFTPQGVLRFPVAATQPAQFIAELLKLIHTLEAASTQVTTAP
ncbi:MAG TPA: transcription-repair coupling factor [Acidobacteriaceae bacterium]|jgi:transcription-repair coupling factor (superfamily II helicase)|nr:transcription-repair coupling factor [Acidobacteriaceae bacterium]